MKQYTMYDAKKQNDKRNIKLYKTRKRVIKKEKADIYSNNNLLYITSGFGLLMCLISLISIKVTKRYVNILWLMFGLGISIETLLEAKKSLTKDDKNRLKELNNKLKDINNSIKQQKISKEDIKKLKKINISHI